MRKLIRFVVFSALIFTGLGLLLNFLVDNPYLHRVVRAYLDQEIRTRTYATVDFEALRISVFPPGIEVYGVSIAEASAPEVKWVQAASASVRLSWGSLFLGTPRLSRVEVVNLQTAWPLPDMLLQTKGQAEDVPRPKPAVWPPPFDPPVETVTLRGARLMARFPSDEPPSPTQDSTDHLIALEGVDLDLDIDSWRRASVKLAVLSTSFDYEGRGVLAGERLDADFEFVQDTVYASRVDLVGPRVDLRSQVEVKLGVLNRSMPDELAVSGQLQSKVDLLALGAFIDADDSRGPAEAHGRLEVRLPRATSASAEAPEVQVSVTLSAQAQDAALGGFKLHQSSADLHITRDNIEFKDIRVRKGDQVFGHAQGTLALDDRNAFRFDLEPRGLGFSALMDTLGASVDALDFEMGAPSVVISGTGEPFLLSVRGPVELRRIRFPGLKLPQKSVEKVVPLCRATLVVDVRDDGVAFDNTTARCFDEVSTTRNLDINSPKMFDVPSREDAVTDVRLRGRVDFGERERVSLGLDSASLDLRLASNFLHVPAQGRAAVRVAIASSGKEPVRTSVDLSGRDWALFHRPVSEGRVSVTIDPDRLVWKDVVLKGPRDELVRSPRGQLSLDDELGIDTEVDVQGLTLEDVRGVLRHGWPELPLDMGLASLRGRWRGPLVDPARYRGMMTVDANAVTWQGEVLAEQLVASVAMEDKGWSFRDIVARLGTLEVKGSIEHQRAGSRGRPTIGANILDQIGMLAVDPVGIKLEAATVHAEAASQGIGFRGNQLGRLPFLRHWFRDALIDGDLRGKATLSGLRSELQGSVELRIDDLSLRGSRMPPIKLQGLVDRGKVDVRGRQGGNQLDARLAIDTHHPDMTYESFLRLSQWDARPLLGETLALDPRNYLYLSGEWESRGILTDVLHSSGRVVIEDLSLVLTRDVLGRPYPIRMALDRPVELEASQGRWKVKRSSEILWRGTLGQLRLVPRALDLPDKVQVEVDGLFRAATLRHLTPAVETASGNVVFSGSLAGSMGELEIDLALQDEKKTTLNAAEWEPLGLGLAEFRPPLRNIRAEVLVHDGVIDVKTFTGEKGTGVVTATGVLAGLVGSSDIDTRLVVTGTDAAMVWPMGVFLFDSTVDAQCVVTGQSVPYKIGGQVTVKRARSSKEFDVRDEIVNAAFRQRQAQSGKALRAPLFELDLGLRSASGIHIANRNMNLDLSSQLQITGSDARPIVQGQVSLDRGKFVYKRDFNIARGILFFDDPLVIDPRLDITAQSDVSSYRVSVNISGRASSPIVDMAVDPPTREGGTPISKVDILVLLSSGELPNREQAVDDTQSVAEVEALGIAVGQLEEPLQKIFDLSGQTVVRKVYADTYQPETGGSPVVRFNLPIRVTDDVNVVVRVDHKRNSFLTSEYALTQDVTLSGAIESLQQENATGQEEVQRDAGLDMRFKFSFP